MTIKLRRPNFSSSFMFAALSLSFLISLRFAHDDGTCTSSLACLALNPSSGDTKGAGYLAVGAESGESVHQAIHTTTHNITPQYDRRRDTSFFCEEQTERSSV